MSVYNGSEHLSNALNSVVSQDYCNWELIAIDDCSTDDSLKILQDFAENDNRISVFPMKKNVGLTKALNFAISQSTGVYIARIDHDDKWKKEKLRIQVDFLDSNLDYGIVGCQVITIADNLHVRPKKSLPTSNNQIKKCLSLMNPFVHSAVLIRLSMLRSVGLYNLNFKYAQDYELWTRCLAHSKGKNIGEVLCYLNTSDHNISNKHSKVQRFLSIIIKCLAIKRGHFSWLFFVYLVKDLIFILMPRQLWRPIIKMRRFGK